jgi:osmotically-inducible protein OsmY
MANVRKGVVKLKGMVENHRCRLLAETIAASFEECSEVVNELVVEAKGRVTDEELTETVRSELDSHPDVSSEVISATVKDGMVTLRGNIVGAWERGLVENATRNVRGVRDIRNEVAVDLTRSMEDESLCCAIVAVLAEEADLDGTAIRVAVVNGAALLSGAVPTLSQKDLAEAVARRVGVTGIQNEVIVTDA